MDDYKRSLEEKEIDQNWKMETERQRIEKQRKIDDEQQGPFKYYIIKILALLDPTHPVCNQTLLIKKTNFMLLHNHLAYPIHPPLLIT